MAKVTVSDIIIPEVFDPYFIELTAKKSNLIRSGIVIPDPYMDELALRGGTTINMPFFTDLQGSSQVLSDSSPLSPGNIETASDVARLQLRGDARSVNDLSGALSGADPLKAIASLIGSFWVRDEQAVLIETLKGVFADNLDNDSGDLIHTHAAETTAGVKSWNDAAPTVMCPEAIIDGQALLGDSQNSFAAIVMHSKCFTDLLKQELIETVRPSEGRSVLYYYLDKEVIVDDNCPTRLGTAGSDKSTVYQSFLFAKGAVARGEGAAPVPSELDRQALASDTNLITRRHYILHPRGFKWGEVSVTGGHAPNNTDLANDANWSRVYEKKNVRIAMIETN